MSLMLFDYTAFYDFVLSKLNDLWYTLSLWGCISSGFLNTFNGKVTRSNQDSQEKGKAIVERIMYLWCLIWGVWKNWEWAGGEDNM